MSKKKFLIFIIIMLLVTFKITSVVNAEKIGNATVIDKETLIEKSDLSELKLSLTTVPEITVEGSHTYEIHHPGTMYAYKDSDKVIDSIEIIFTDVEYDEAIDDVVTTFFSNCGTLNGEAIDMKIIYSDFYSGSQSPYSTANRKGLAWSAYDDQDTKNEWFRWGWEKFNMKIYFYYHGENTAIYWNISYFSLYSLDGGTLYGQQYGEGIASLTATETYIYENSILNYTTATYDEKTYEIYYGTNEELNSDDSRENSASFKFENTDNIDVEMVTVLGNIWTAGYHINIDSIAVYVPDNPIKTVSKETVTTGNEIEYVVSQNLPDAQTKSFELSSFVFCDELDSNFFEYENLIVKDEEGNDITSLAGTISYENNILTYTFYSEYLSSITCTGQTYIFAITGTVNDTMTEGSFDNTSEVIINGVTLTSNTVTTEVELPPIDLELSKEGEQKITSLEDAFRYSINYKAYLDNYYEKEDVEIKIIDSLPYKIDTTKEYDLAGGVYDSDRMTITWSGIYSFKNNKIVWEDGSETVLEDNTDTYLIQTDDMNQIVINRDVVFYYENIDWDTSTIVNNVYGSVNITSINKKKETTAEVVTELDLTENIMVIKNWVGDENDILTRPQSVNIVLYATVNGLDYDITAFVSETEITVTDTENWTYIWENLPKYTNEGQEIEYSIQETSKFEEYYLSSITSDTTVDGEITYTVTNSKYGSITLTKVDKSDTSTKLGGATFKLEKLLEENGEYIVDESFEAITLTTVSDTESNDFGTLTFENLEYGIYKITETVAPEGYNLSTDTLTVKVDSDNVETSVTATDKKKTTLPVTGENGVFYIIIAGMVLLIIGIKNGKIKLAKVKFTKVNLAKKTGFTKKTKYKPKH